ncbi:alkaline shock response membrane anchor protein AmaP [Lacticaseibacillus zhaodongensis]|uniref:alkaline shock response membrane anchor protein AmaP n=1 Tax=Lacticaseibacillus zhaodongensis TaxID=2668065 RepID=UPI0012D2C1E1|nr:alkaline shock response membrane anchor protein AmaP [Lacticaseibacillus zhaodongensis]
MRPSTKVILALVAILVLLQAAVVTAVVWPLTSISNLSLIWEWLRIVVLALTAVVAVVGLGLLGVALLRRSSSRDLHIKTDRGELVLSKQAVEKSVAAAVASEHDVKDVQADVKLRRNEVTRAKVTVSQWQVADAQNLGQTIESTVRDELAATLGVPVRRVRIRIQQAKGKAAAQVI